MPPQPHRIIFQFPAAFSRWSDVWGLVWWLPRWMFMHQCVVLSEKEMHSVYSNLASGTK